jgi:hypothetical protein
MGRQNAKTKDQNSIDNINEYVHCTSANHSFFARFRGSERKVMQRSFPRAHCFAGFSPNFRFDTSAADRARHLSILKEQHLCAALLWGGASRMRNSGDNNTLATPPGFIDHAIKIWLGDC